MEEETSEDGEQVEEEDSEDITFNIVLVNRLEDLTAPVLHMAGTVKCIFCRKECTISKATLEHANQRFKDTWRPICQRCAAKKKIQFNYKPMTPQQLAEMEAQRQFIQDAIKGRGS